MDGLAAIPLRVPRRDNFAGAQAGRGLFYRHLPDTADSERVTAGSRSYDNCFNRWLELGVLECCARDIQKRRGIVPQSPDYDAEQVREPNARLSGPHLHALGVPGIPRCFAHSRCEPSLQQDMALVAGPIDAARMGAGRYAAARPTAEGTSDHVS